MSKIFLTCFAPFKPFSSDDEAAIDLFSSLSIDLQRLQKFLEQKPLSLGWCSQAMMVIKKIHRHFLYYVERSKEDAETLDEYMRSSLDLLDLCNLLKVSLSGLHRYRMMADVMINRLESSEFSMEAAMIELERLSTVEKWGKTKFTKEETLKVKPKTSMSNNNMKVLKRIRNTMSVMCFLIMYSILGTEINEGLYQGLFSLGCVYSSMEELVSSFRKWSQNEGNKTGLILYEKEMIEGAFDSFKDSVLNGVEKGAIVEKMENLRMRCVALKEGLDLFEGMMNELFEDVIKGRKRVIQFITKNNYIP